MIIAHAVLCYYYYYLRVYFSCVHMYVYTICSNTVDKLTVWLHGVVQDQYKYIDGKHNKYGIPYFQDEPKGILLICYALAHARQHNVH